MESTKQAGSIRGFSRFVLALVVAIAAVPPACAFNQLPPGTIIVSHWPEGLPCNVLKKYPDGTYEITVPFVTFGTIHLKAKYKGTEITRYWDRECRGRTQ
jgi:hypothetical protein